MKLTRAQYVDNLEQANTASFKPWVYASIACSSIGLGFTSLWCLVMGHTEAFIPPATLDDPFANPRLFFLIGALLCSVFYIAMPGQLRQHDTKLRVILPVLGAVGTVAFALPTQGLLGPSSPIVACGLATVGAIQFWLSARFVLMVARTRGTGATVACVTGWIIAKLLMIEIIGASPSSTVQIVCAVAAPFLAAALFEISCALMRRAAVLEAGEGAPSRDDSSLADRTVFGVPQRTALHTPPAQGDRVIMYLLLFIVAAVLAVMRFVSYLGLWGNTSASIAASSSMLLSVVIPSCIIVLFARYAILLPRHLGLALRFQPALFLTLAGLFAVAMQPYAQGAWLAALSIIVQVSQLFAHLLFWTLIATALDVLSIPSYRTIGVAEAMYAAASIVWVVVLANNPFGLTLAVVFALYLVVVGTLAIIGNLSAREGHRWKTEDEDHERSGLPNNEGTEHTRSVREHCLRLAEDSKLSPRETEVFMLLAQGRSHAFIQDDLGLARGTVNAHVSHIYAKMNVADRQGLLDRIWS